MIHMDPCSICLLDPTPASECGSGSGSSYLNIGAKSRNLWWSAKPSETMTYKWSKHPQLKQSKKILRCQRKSLLFKNNNWKIPYTGILLTTVSQVHGSRTRIRIWNRVDIFAWIRIRIKWMRIHNTGFHVNRDLCLSAFLSFFYKPMLWSATLAATNNPVTD